MRNIEALINVANRVLWDADRIYMPEWVKTDVVSADSKEEAICKTTACVAGWVCIDAGTSQISRPHCGVEDCEYCPEDRWEWSVPDGGWQASAIAALGPDDDDEEYAMTRLFNLRTDAEALDVLQLVRDAGLELDAALAVVNSDSGLRSGREAR